METNRIPEYRGKDGTGEWRYGSLMVEIRKIHNVDQFLFTIREIDGRSEVIVDGKTVGQLIGLVDKNGKKIFEGDIVRCWDGVGKKGELRREYHTPMVVSYCQLWTAFVVEDKPYKTQFQLWKDFSAFEVIGNIHDNPELVKK